MVQLGEGVESGDDGQAHEGVKCSTPSKKHSPEFGYVDEVSTMAIYVMTQCAS